MSTRNVYCEALGIPVPRVEVARQSPDANYYSLLIVALLERGEPITLSQAAKRLDEAGVGPADQVLAALKRCKPGRPPLYRTGELYALDPHDHEADLWAFRLGLRPAKAPRLQVVRPEPGPLPSIEEPLTIQSLDEAWRDGIPNHWTAQRIAICVLDAQRTAMSPDEVLAFVRARDRGQGTRLSADAANYWRTGAPVRAREDGLWALDRTHAAVASARQAVRDRIATARRWAEQRPDRAVIEANRKHFERQRRAHAERLIRMRRVLIHAFPAKHPEAVVLLDVERREIATFMSGEIAAAREKLAGYDILAAVEVRTLLRCLDFESGDRRLAELGPPQKTRQLNRRGRTLRITTSLLVQGSCGISQPFGDEEVLRGYLLQGQSAKLLRRLEADAKSLHALYQYGRLHGTVRLRWGFLDEMLPAPWVHRDEATLYDLERRALELRVPLEVVTGSAPGWADPWSRVRRAHVEKDETGWRSWLVDDAGHQIDRREIQLARLPGNNRGAT